MAQVFYMARELSYQYLSRKAFKLAETTENSAFPLSTLLHYFFYCQLIGQRCSLYIIISWMLPLDSEAPQCHYLTRSLEKLKH